MSANYAAIHSTGVILLLCRDYYGVSLTILTQINKMRRSAVLTLSFTSYSVKNANSINHFGQIVSRIFFEHFFSLSRTEPQWKRDTILSFDRALPLTVNQDAPIQYEEKWKYRRQKLLFPAHHDTLISLAWTNIDYHWPSMSIGKRQRSAKCDSAIKYVSNESGFVTNCSLAHCQW